MATITGVERYGDVNVRLSLEFRRGGVRIRGDFVGSSTDMRQLHLSSLHHPKTTLTLSNYMVLGVKQVDARRYTTVFQDLRFMGLGNDPTQGRLVH